MSSVLMSASAPAVDCFAPHHQQQQQQQAAAGAGGIHTATATHASPAPAHNHVNVSHGARSADPPRPQVYGGARQGAKPYQEDSFFSWCSPSSKVIVGGIFDGHGGYNGLLASQTARDTALIYLQDNAHACESWSVDQWRNELHALFSHMHSCIRDAFLSNYASPTAPAPGNSFTNAKPPAEARHVDSRGIVRNAAGDPIHGGSTATLVVMVKDCVSGAGGATLITANVGDSTAFLCPTRGYWDFLSTDHGPENQDEWHRINTSAEEAHLYQTKLLFVYDKTSVYRKYECPCVFLPDGTKDQQYVANPWGNGLHPTNVRYEPAVYAVTPRHITKDSTCIAMTRALGDCYAHQFGLTHVPSISVKRISADADPAAGGAGNSYATQEQAYTIFLASDGVWDCWRYDDLHQFLNDELGRGKSLLEMGEAVLEESISRAITNFGAKHYDDACLVAWQFTPTRTKHAQQPEANGATNAREQPQQEESTPDAEMA